MPGVCCYRTRLWGTSRGTRWRGVRVSMGRVQTARWVSTRRTGAPLPRLRDGYWARHLRDERLRRPCHLPGGAPGTGLCGTAARSRVHLAQRAVRRASADENTRHVLVGVELLVALEGGAVVRDVEEPELDDGGRVERPSVLAGVSVGMVST